MIQPITTVSKGITDKLNGMIDRTKSMQSFLETYIYRMYQNAENERWLTENQSEGPQWDQVGDNYAKWKRKKFAAYEGAGTKLLIATGTMYHAVVGPAQGQLKLVTNTKLYISTDVPYAGEVNKLRNFSRWSSDTYASFNRAIKDFIVHNINRGAS